MGKCVLKYIVKDQDGAEYAAIGREQAIILWCKLSMGNKRVSMRVEQLDREFTRDFSECKT